MDKPQSNYVHNNPHKLARWWCLGTRLQAAVKEYIIKMISLLSVHRDRNYLATASKLG